MSGHKRGKKYVDVTPVNPNLKSAKPITEKPVKSPKSATASKTTKATAKTASTAKKPAVKKSSAKKQA